MTDDEQRQAWLFSVSTRDQRIRELTAACHRKDDHINSLSTRLAELESRLAELRNAPAPGCSHLEAMKDAYRKLDGERAEVRSLAARIDHLEAMTMAVINNIFAIAKGHAEAGSNCSPHVMP